MVALQMPVYSTYVDLLLGIFFFERTSLAVLPNSKFAQKTKKNFLFLELKGIFLNVLFRLFGIFSLLVESALKSMAAFEAQG